MSFPWWMRAASDSSVALPPPPTRAEMLAGTSRLQGVTVTTKQYGTFPAFGPEINMLDDPDDRQAYYRAQAAAGTNVLCIGWGGSTYTSGGYTYPVPGPEMRWVNDLTGYCDRLVEALQTGLFRGLLITLPGDGFTTPDNPFGYQFLMAHVAELVAAMKTHPVGDLTQYVIFSPGFDGVVWTWNEIQVMSYGHLMRGLLPNGYLALEYPAGVLGVYGEGKEQYMPTPTDPRLTLFDLFLQEGPYTLEDNPDQVWQIAARMLGPKYHRPASQPADDDPGAPFAAGSGQDYLSGGTPRGPFATWFWEFDTYGWVRGCPLDQVLRHRAYLESVGYPSVG